MIRQTDIPHISPGEVITAAMLNQLRRGANGGRMVVGGNGSSTTMIGNKVGIASTFDLSHTADYMVSLSAPVSTLYPTLPALGGGFYYGTIYPPANIYPNSTKAQLEVPSPMTNLAGQIIPNCLLMNVAEDGRAGNAIVKSLTTFGKLVGYSIQKQFGAIPVLAVSVNPYVAISLLITSDFAAGSLWGRYKAKSYTPGSATATATTASPGTLAAAEDIIFINGAEWGLATSNNLLVSPNTASFAVGPVSGTVVGSCVISSVTYRIVVGWVGFVACSSTSTPAFGF